MTIGIAFLTLLVCCAPAARSATSVAALRTEIRGEVRAVEQAKTTLRFFRNHSILFYKWKTKRVAHLERDSALERVRAGRARLVVLRARLKAALPKPIPHLNGWLCIHDGQRHGPYVGNGVGEGPWDANTGNGYYGGLQMDVEFQQTYGIDLYRAKGTADHWTPREQMIVAERAYLTRGFYPWPNTARYCGLI